MLLSNKNLRVITKTKQRPQIAAAATKTTTMEPAADAYADLLSMVTAVNILRGSERGHKKRDNSNNNNNHNRSSSNIALHCKRKLAKSDSSQYHNNKNDKIKGKNNNKNGCNNGNSSDFNFTNNHMNNNNNNKKSNRQKQCNNRNNNSSHSNHHSSSNSSGTKYSSRHAKTFNSNNKNDCLSFEQHFASFESNSMEQYFLTTAHSQGSSSNNNHNNNDDTIISCNMSGTGHHVHPSDSWHGPVVADEDGGSSMLSNFMLKVDNAAVNELVIDGCDYAVADSNSGRNDTGGRDVIAGDDIAQPRERARESDYAAALHKATTYADSNVAIDAGHFECLQQLVDRNHEHADNDDEHNDARFQFASEVAQQQTQPNARQQLTTLNASKRNVTATSTTTATAAHYLPICLSNVGIGDCVEYLNDELEDLKVMIVC